MPFPHFNMMSFWVTFVAFLVLMSSFILGDGPTLGGWTQYAPLNAVVRLPVPGRVWVWCFGRPRLAYFALASCWAH